LRRWASTRMVSPIPQGELDDGHPQIQSQNRNPRNGPCEPNGHCEEDQAREAETRGKTAASKATRAPARYLAKQGNGGWACFANPRAQRFDAIMKVTELAGSTPSRGFLCRGCQEKLKTGSDVGRRWDGHPGLPGFTKTRGDVVTGQAASRQKGRSQPFEAELDRLPALPVVRASNALHGAVPDRTSQGPSVPGLTSPQHRPAHPG